MQQHATSAFLHCKELRVAVPSLSHEMLMMDIKVQAANKTVLVVDNDPLVMLGTAVMLREIGYHVVTATSPQDALGAFQHDDAPSILVTDYSMPVMTGVELAEAVLRLHAATRILIVTGHSELDEHLPDEWQLLTKPFSSVELRDALVRLDQTRPTSTSG